MAALASGFIVVTLTVALINEAVERRRRERWSVLAQYVMLQLVRDARIVWTVVAELAGLMPSDPYATEGDVLTAATTIDAGSSAVRDTGRLTAALRELVANADKRERLHDKVTTFLEHNDAVPARSQWLRCSPLLVECSGTPWMGGSGLGTPCSPGSLRA